MGSKIAISAPMCTPCFDFTADGRNYEKRSVVIALIVTEELKDGVTKYSYGCSRGPSCQDSKCRYSHKRRFEGENEGIDHLASYGDR